MKFFLKTLKEDIQEKKKIYMIEKINSLQKKNKNAKL
jgi:hypothetical protein